MESCGEGYWQQVEEVTLVGAAAGYSRSSEAAMQQDDCTVGDRRSSWEIPAAEAGGILCGIQALP